jgi:hypothetical protein
MPIVRDDPEPLRGALGNSFTPLVMRWHAHSGKSSFCLCHDRTSEERRATPDILYTRADNDRSLRCVPVSSRRLRLLGVFGPVWPEEAAFALVERARSLVHAKAGGISLRYLGRTQHRDSRHVLLP